MMSSHSPFLAGMLLLASAAAVAGPKVPATEKKARSECWMITRGWDTNLPARACDDPALRPLAMKRAHELCEKERLMASGALRLQRCLSPDDR